MNDAMDTLADELADVFSAVPHQGNQLAVVHEGADLDGRQMQRLGQEFNLSETAAVREVEAHPGGLRARVRLFTATVELPIAGHPLLGTAALLAHRHGQARKVLLEAPAAWSR
ncbi:PhzF family phenazine biosynthesis protein [Streptomyces albipurpureus]|uniref:PhzF family phenazine biosynthesis protein n=1 Tax=Streptomyces albipurpureus TaxID=2897419 RepID=A0ABT0UG45_9ACTN|nr:PhzF family phenazine biosynthesis protein [Streptomyces sp. CWNU-1]MCM2387393.1 PhzF family phenazine biosynthesis protein [Streptomyces sp. CWNU-1]